MGNRIFKKYKLKKPIVIPNGVDNIFLKKLNLIHLRKKIILKEISSIFWKIKCN